MQFEYARFSVFAARRFNIECRYTIDARYCFGEVVYWFDVDGDDDCASVVVFAA